MEAYQLPSPYTTNSRTIALLIPLTPIDRHILSSSARAYLEIIDAQCIDYRSIPHIMVCDVVPQPSLLKTVSASTLNPENIAQALAQLASQILKPHDRVLRLRSDKQEPPSPTPSAKPAQI